MLGGNITPDEKQSNPPLSWGLYVVHFSISFSRLTFSTWSLQTFHFTGHIVYFTHIRGLKKNHLFLN